jgi:LuxR family transcriptional regulator, maltose regulon positive regulatory protein
MHGVTRQRVAVPRVPAATVSRHRLFDAVDAGVVEPLTLLAAPAGSGKSALLASWVADGRAPGPVAWITLGDGAADSARFWSAALDALARATGDARLDALAASPRETLEATLVLPALVDALAARDEPVVLVLDDFHEVAGAVHAEVERLVRFPPPALRLVIATRVDPQIGLGRLRLEGRLAEIRSRDLAFDLVEAAALFGAHEVPIASEDLEALWERTEGWAAGLSLAALSLRDHADPARFVERFAGTDATVSDYLVSEVLAHQPADLREFLLRTSIADPLCGVLADALTGGSDGQQALGRLERGGALLTAVDEHGTWYRYHPLFAELLRAELRAQYGRAVVDDLHRRAAAWLAAHDDVVAALWHVVAGRAWELGADLVVERWVDLIVDGDGATLLPLLDAMPRARVDACPELALAFGAALLAAGRSEQADSLLRAADGREASVPAERRARFTAAMAAIRLRQERGRGGAARTLRAAHERLAGHRDLEPDEASAGLRSLVLTQLGIVELWTGDLDAAVADLERACALTAEEGGERAALGATAYLALASLLRNELARAVRRAEEALAIAERGGWGRSEPAGVALCVLAAVAIQRHRLVEAERLVAEAAVALRDTRDRPLRSLHALNRVLLLGDRGDHAAALDVLQCAREDLEGWPVLAPMRDAVTAQEGLLRAANGEAGAGRAVLERAGRRAARSVAIANAVARLDLGDGQPAQARAALAPHLGNGSSGNGGPLSSRAEAWLLDALALDALAEHDEAARSLERALDLAEPAGLRRILAVHGAAAAPLLRRHGRYGTAHPAMVGEALDAVERGGRARARDTPAALMEPLSEREQAILRYLPTMMSNQEIAGELFVSVNTIKTHLKAIYRKLDAPGRREAVGRARELGLMP